jgi:transcriptional regulator with XRE-family HTH domain
MKQSRDTDLRQIVAGRIKSARARAGLTLSQVGDKMGVSRITVWRWERGENAVTIEDGVRLATALGRSPGALLRELTRPGAD